MEWKKEKLDHIIFLMYSMESDFSALNSHSYAGTITHSCFHSPTSL